MSFTWGEPVPEILRNSLQEVLEERDYPRILPGNGRLSEATVKSLLNGTKITEQNVEAVQKMVEYGMAKCDKLVALYTQLKIIINTYNDETDEAP